MGWFFWCVFCSGDHGDEGYGVVKSPDSGNLEWDRRYGSERDDIGRDFIATKDGYLVVGQKQT